VFRIIVCAEIGSVFSNSDGNRNVPYLNWNDDKRQLNANDFDNDWNSDNRFLVFRTSPHERIAFLTVSTQKERLFCLTLFYPPSQHFSNFMYRSDDLRVLLVIEMFEFPCDLYRKNFKRSSLTLAFAMIVGFCSRTAYPAKSRFSRRSRNCCSIFMPSECRYRRGKSGKYFCQSL